MLWAATAAAAAACATNPRIYSSSNPEADFSSYSTYSYLPQLGTEEPGAPESLLTQFLKAAVDREMAARGFRRVPQDGELLVNFYVETRERTETRTVASPAFGVGYYRYRRGFYVGWHDYSEIDVSQYTEGTLNIDVADAARRQLVWEGIAIGRLTEEARQNVRATVDAVVPQVFSQFPVETGP
jgi:hypothetical protein